MAGPDLWPQVHAQRLAVADLLEGLTPEQWEQPTLCEGWLVRDAVAHMIATGHTTPGSFLLGLAGAGFRFHTFSARNIAKRRDHDPQQLVSELRETATLRKAPPGPTQTPLSEIVVHGEDVARPLGIRREVPAETLVACADFYKKAQPLIGGRKRVAGLRLVGTDTGWQTGDGPEVRGPTASLLLAMAGRPAGLADLTGDGVATMTTRMP